MRSTVGKPYIIKPVTLRETVRIKLDRRINTPEAKQALKALVVV